jgi:hypothetical protein
MIGLLKKIKRDISNIPGWKTKRKIVVFESDDWGSIRMPDKKTFNFLLSKGIRVDKCPYNKYDSLASEGDLSSLFEVLDSYRDSKGYTPIITANCVVANPDFEKIRASGFQEYHYELFTETLKKYPKHSNSFKLWEEGIEKRLFYPQFHGREHLKVSRWMNALKLNKSETRLSFDHNLFGISTTITSEKRKSYLDAFALDNESEEDQIKKIVVEGLLLFKEIFGYSSRSFIAPNYVWPSTIECDMSKLGVKYIQGISSQYSTQYGASKAYKIHHFTGQNNAFGQIFTVRNCQFEPSLYNKRDSVRECLAQMNSAFKCGKPAIITTHRVNYIGFIEESNRDKSLLKLKDLLLKAQIRWPDLEFMTTEQLGDLICRDKS